MRKFSKILSALLAVMMIFTLFTVPAFADAEELPQLNVKFTGNN